MKSKQYGGGASKIQQVLKCSKARADSISDAYDDLYKVTLQFNARNVQFAQQHGYAECAFGLRLQTPRIKSFDSGVKSGEERSSNNAVTQSWGMLTNRAIAEFDQRVESAGLTKDVKLINTIHDSIYMLIREDAELIAWVNKNLVECMQWQEHPTIQSDVKMMANLEIGRSWKQQIELENGATLEDIQSVLDGLDDEDGTK